MRCANCKYWGRNIGDGTPREAEDRHVSWTCNAGVVGRYGECAVLSKDDPDDAPMAFAACAGEGIYGQLITRDDFSCILFAAHEKEPG